MGFPPIVVAIWMTSTLRGWDVSFYMSRDFRLCSCVVFRFTYTWILEANGDRSISLLSIAEPSARIILLCTTIPFCHLCTFERVLMKN